MSAPIGGQPRDRREALFELLVRIELAARPDGFVIVSHDPETGHEEACALCTPEDVLAEEGKIREDFDRNGLADVTLRLVPFVGEWPAPRR